MIEQVLSNSAIGVNERAAYKASDFSDRVMQTHVTRLIEGSGIGGLVGFIMAILSSSPCKMRKRLLFKSMPLLNNNSLTLDILLVLLLIKYSDLIYLILLRFVST